MISCCVDLAPSILWTASGRNVLTVRPSDKGGGKSKEAEVVELQPLLLLSVMSD